MCKGKFFSYAALDNLMFEEEVNIYVDKDGLCVHPAHFAREIHIMRIKIWGKYA